MTSWSELSDGLYSRPIGENERFIKLVGDSGLALEREHWAINSTATIRPTEELKLSSLVSRLRYAWGHLRFQQPSLAAYVAEDNQNLLYEVPTGDAFEKWLQSTFNVSEPSTSIEEVITMMKPGPYATLTYIQKSNEILGHTAHWRSDGIGVIILLDNLLKLAVQSELSDPKTLPWGEETVRLAPPIEDAGNVPHNANEQQLALGKEYAETFGHISGAIGIPFQGDSSTLPQGTLVARGLLSAADTDAVIKACETHKVSVTSAVHASIAAANWELAADDRKDEHYTSTVRFALRPYLPSPYSTSAYAAALYTTGWMVKVEPDETWLQHVKQYNFIYRSGLPKEYFGFHRAYGRALMDLIQNAAPGLTPSDVDISSLGLADKLISSSYGTGRNAIEVLAVSVGVEILTRQATCFVWTFRGQLNLNVTYNEAYHTPEQMEVFVNAVKAVLLRELGIRDG